MRIDIINKKLFSTAQYYAKNDNHVPLLPEPVQIKYSYKDGR